MPGTAELGVAGLGVGESPDDADSEGVGFGCPVGCGVEATTDGSLDAAAEACWAGDVGGVGPVHTFDGDGDGDV